MRLKINEKPMKITNENDTETTYQIPRNINCCLPSSNEARKTDFWTQPKCRKKEFTNNETHWYLYVSFFSRSPRVNSSGTIRF